MLFTCDACNYTFEALSLPTSCPDCEKRTVTRRIADKYITVPAVRPATEAETTWYNDVQAELQAEEQQQERVQLLSERSGLSDDEYNWLLVVLYINNKPITAEARILVWSQLRISLKTPEKALEHYQVIQKSFARAIAEDRDALRAVGKSEPSFGLYHVTEDGEMVIDEERVNEYNDCAPALSVLYRFRSKSPLFLRTPTLGDLRRIDLKKIAEDRARLICRHCWIFRRSSEKRQSPRMVTHNNSESRYLKW